MHVEWLELRDFRCYGALEFRPEPGINVLVGSNGSGKTSVLEAIAYASALRSFRRTPDESLVAGGATEAIVRVGLGGEQGERKIEISVPVKGRRRVLLNGKRPRTNSDLAEALTVVAFLPDDLDLVKGSPGRRRDFLDELGAALSLEAAVAQGDYARALRQRNALLRQEGRHADPVTLDVWDERLSNAGAAVAVHRLDLLDRMQPGLVEAHESVAVDGEIRSVYRSNWSEEIDSRTVGFYADRLAKALHERRSRDLEIRSTSVGPHRDDPIFELDGRVARNQASQGEQRSLALALRLVSYRLLRERFGRPPVLLLDDVFSELDVTRASGVMEILPEGQVFVTSAREDEVPLAGRRWRVSAGSVR